MALGNPVDPRILALGHRVYHPDDFQRMADFINENGRDPQRWREIQERVIAVVRGWIAEIAPDCADPAEFITGCLGINALLPWHLQLPTDFITDEIIAAWNAARLPVNRMYAEAAAKEDPPVRTVTEAARRFLKEQGMSTDTQETVGASAAVEDGDRA